MAATKRKKISRLLITSCAPSPAMTARMIPAAISWVAVAENNFFSRNRINNQKDEAITIKHKMITLLSRLYRSGVCSCDWSEENGILIAEDRKAIIICPHLASQLHTAAKGMEWRQVIHFHRLFDPHPVARISFRKVDLLVFKVTEVQGIL